MTPESMGHDLTRNDPAHQPRCPMEALADRFLDAPKPAWLKCAAERYPDGTVHIILHGWMDRTSRVEDLINYLASVKG